MPASFDFIILGAGINGCGIARALSLRGRRVLVLDKAGIGTGTSSKSSRLIHGGLRYLENLEISLVKESLTDRRRLLDLYPDLVRLLPFYLPVYNDSRRKTLIIRLGLALYSFMGDSQNESSRIPNGAFASIFENITTTKLCAVFQYYDAKTNDLELVKKVAQDAKDKNTQFLEDTEVCEIRIDSDAIMVKINQDTFTTNNLINATGPWIDDVTQQYSLPSNYQIMKVSGTHIELGKKLVPFPLFLQTKTNRILFMIPEFNTTIVGTTERIEKGPCDQVCVNEDDVRYLLENVNRYLNNPMKHEDIVRSWVGIRPLIEGRKDLSRISRGYKLDFHRIGKNKVLNVFGGKLTTFLSLSDKVVRVLDNDRRT